MRYALTMSLIHAHSMYIFRNYLYQSESQLILNLRLLLMNRNNKRKRYFIFSPHLMYLCMHIQSRYLSQAVNSGKDFQDFQPHLNGEFLFSIMI